MAKPTDDEILATLNSYRTEAEKARTGGFEDREAQWKANKDIYWARYDFEGKAKFQSKIPLPHGAMFVDRWAAACNSALMLPGEWYMIEARGDPNKQLEVPFRRFLDYWLSRCSLTPTGQTAGFGHFFEAQLKLGAMMAGCATVTWDERRKRVAVETVDPTEVLLDATGRGMYRIRRQTRDWYEFWQEVQQNPKLWNLKAIEELKAYHDQAMVTERERLVSHGAEPGLMRKPITLDYYYCWIIDSTGKVTNPEKQLAVVGNERFLVRRPEPNPYWHGDDWLVYCPYIAVPLSVYGKTYMETWATIAELYVRMTNIILDGAFTSALRMFAARPEALKDANQLTDGLAPFKMLLLEDGYTVEDVLATFDLGDLKPSVLTAWQAIKQELREAAATNDIDLGQTVPKGDVTATEINAVTTSGTELIRSIARTIEQGQVDQILSLVWRTGLQHFDAEDEELKAAVGPEAFSMFVARRAEFSRTKVVFQARGISGVIERNAKLRSLLQTLQIIAQSPGLLQVFMQALGPEGLMKLIRELFRLNGLDAADLVPQQSTVASGPMLSLVGGAPAPAAPIAQPAGVPSA